jgi:hypothetical protein
MAGEGVLRKSGTKRMGLKRHSVTRVAQKPYRAATVTERSVQLSSMGIFR